ncbi:hypothetical protein AKJ16_DCAP06555 [Drosera capensis]
MAQWATMRSSSTTLHKIEVLAIISIPDFQLLSETLDHLITTSLHSLIASSRNVALKKMANFIF